ncbi:MAG: glycerophosphoryl diester phosphodiesterase, partial [Ilumatobacteraceae bacterium]|nr:glycerophosphoryl diester phosphodiesterase [Ilumatobacteraceae bacterium]
MRRALPIVAGLAALALMAGCSSSATTTPSSGPTPSPLATTAPSTIPSTSPPSASTEASAPVATTAPTTVPPTTETPTTATPTTTPPTTVAPTTSDSQPTGPLTVQQLLDLSRPIVLAHASGEDQHPHSTPFGYAESVREGVDMLDFDVQLTADGVLVVQHDDTTGRTTNEDVAVADTDYA